MQVILYQGAVYVVACVTIWVYACMRMHVILISLCIHFVFVYVRIHMYVYVCMRV